MNEIKTLETVRRILEILILLAIVTMLVVLPGCKTQHKSNQSTKDSVTVNRTNEGSSKIDSSGSKSDKTNTKETVYYPQPIIVPGKDGNDRIIFVPQSTKETGSEKNEDFNLSKDSQWKDRYDSLMYATLLASKSGSTKVGFTTFEIIMMIAGGLIALKMFGPQIIKIFKPL